MTRGRKVSRAIAGIAAHQRRRANRWAAMLRRDDIMEANRMTGFPLRPERLRALREAHETMTTDQILEPVLTMPRYRDFMNRFRPVRDHLVDADARVAAVDKAWATLRRYLRDDEWAAMGRQGFLEIKSPNHKGRVYRVPRHDGVVSVQQDGAHDHTICVRPVDPVPWADVMLAYKLGIEGAEDEWLARANKWGLPGEPAGDGGFLIPHRYYEQLGRLGIGRLMGANRYQVQVDWAPDVPATVTVRHGAEHDILAEEIRGNVDEIAVTQRCGMGGGQAEHELTLRSPNRSSVLRCRNITMRRYQELVCVPLRPDFVAAPRQPSEWGPTVTTRQHNVITADADMTPEDIEQIRGLFAQQAAQRANQMVYGEPDGPAA